MCSTLSEISDVGEWLLLKPQPLWLQRWPQPQDLWSEVTQKVPITSFPVDGQSLHGDVFCGHQRESSGDAAAKLPGALGSSTFCG